MASDVVSAGTSGAASSLVCSLEAGAAVVAAACPGLRGRLMRGEGDLGLAKEQIHQLVSNIWVELGLFTWS